MDIVFSGDGKRSIYEAYRASFPDAACGGRGTCGKCRVRVVGNVASALPLPDDAETGVLSPDEIAAGIRLACRCRPAGDCVVSLPGDVAGFRAIAAYSVPRRFGAGFSAPGERFGVAVDIGTTTVAMELVDRADGSVLSRQTFLNGQRRFGADVLSRVRAATEGFAGELRAAIRSDLSSGLVRLLAAAPSVDPSRVDAIAIAANLTMAHLLLGLPCEGLGRAPFTPVALAFPELPVGEVLAAPELSCLSPRCSAFVVPAIGTFVGGDIVAGLAALDLPDSAEGPALFIDLGTNAEMALVAAGRLWCTSAASGPAFEGASISCGTGSVPGAVSSVYLEGNHFGYALLGEGDGTADGSRAAARRPVPVGVCGSGLVDFVASALDAGLIVRDGSLVPACADTGILLDASGTIRLSPKDVREFQLAKAAIRAGVATLLSVAHLAPGDVTRVYVAGGFGLYLKESSALRTGLLPREFKGRLVPVGNTALAGATRSLVDPAMAERFDAVIRGATAFELANDPGFAARFIDAMEFD